MKSAATIGNMWEYWRHIYYKFYYKPYLKIKQISLGEYDICEITNSIVVLFKCMLTFMGLRMHWSIVRVSFINTHAMIKQG